jgi:hypothetical protein
MEYEFHEGPMFTIESDTDQHGQPYEGVADFVKRMSNKGWRINSIHNQSTDDPGMRDWYTVIMEKGVWLTPQKIS